MYDVAYKIKIVLSVLTKIINQEEEEGAVIKMVWQ